MTKTLILILFFSTLLLAAKAQQNVLELDTLKFEKQLEFADWLVEYEYFTQLATNYTNNQPDILPVTEWFSYRENNTWHSIGGNITENTFNTSIHVIIDSLFSISEFKGIYDTSTLNASGFALSMAQKLFRPLRDTANLYFNSFLFMNPDQTISIWYLPAFQPSGQAVYGCEWEYIFDKTGKSLLRLNSYSAKITAVWVGQPRELWLNYRAADSPTVGSLFFVQSFRDYFTRIRIDTRISTSTVSKDSGGNYSWIHQMK